MQATQTPYTGARRPLVRSLRATALAATALTTTLALGACGNETSSGGTSTAEVTVTQQSSAPETTTEQQSTEQQSSEQQGSESDTSTDQETSDDQSSDQQTSSDDDSQGTSTTSYEPQEPQSFQGVGTASFTYFKVSMGGGGQQKKVTGYAGYHVTVCVIKLPEEFKDKGEVPVSWGPWSLVAQPGDKVLEQREPKYSPAFPQSVNLKPGQCAKGWLTFADLDEGDKADQVILTYANSVGEKATWSQH